MALNQGETVENLQQQVDELSGLMRKAGPSGYRDLKEDTGESFILVLHRKVKRLLVIETELATSSGASRSRHL